MIVSINQPAYFPWLGYFHRIACSDLHIVLDHVQFEKNSFTNRNQIKTAQGRSWITVPIQTKGRFGQLSIDQLQIVNLNDWSRKHWMSIKLNYARAPHFEEHEPFFETLFQKKWDTLSPLNEAVTSYLLKVFNIKTKIIYSSSLMVDGKKDELILNLCRLFGAKVYLSGALGKNYLRPELFLEAGIKVLFQDYKHPSYDQQHGAFISHLAAIDLLFNHGPASFDILFRDNECLKP